MDWSPTHSEADTSRYFSDSEHSDHISDSEWLPTDGEADISDTDSRCSSGVEHIVFDSGEDSKDSIIFPMLKQGPNIAGSNQEARAQKTVGRGEDSCDVKEKTEVKGSKRHCCKFCNKMNTKMSTHLTRCHSNETEVSQILSLRKGDPMRRAAFMKVQDEGDFQHNWRVLRGDPGYLIPKYKKSSGIREAQDYLACPHCKALYKKNLLSKHDRRCSQKPGGKKMKRGQCASMGKLMLPIPFGMTSAFFEKVVSKLRDDDVSAIVRSDSLILQFGERLFARRDIEEHSSGQINGRLRELGRLCQQLRKNTQMRVSTLTQAVDPGNFDLLTDSVKELGQFSRSTNMCSKGTLALKLGYSLKKCNQILRATAIKNNDAEIKGKSDRFEDLYTSDWFDSISACASQSVQRAKMNKPKLLPSLAAVEKVHGVLEKDSHSDSYPTLAKSTLAAITIFNRKRGGEVQRMKCADYIQSKKSNMSHPDKDIVGDLTPTEKKLVDKLHRVEVRGKFNRAVAILLTPSMVEGIEKLLALRTLLGLDSDYLFITPTGERPYRGPAVLKTYAEKAGVGESEIFTATSLRKQLATLSQAMELTKLSQDQLASFLGHDIRVFRNIYRQPLEVMQKAKVASILLKVNRGVELPVDSTDAVEDEDLIPDEAAMDEENTDDMSDEEMGEERTQNNEETCVSTPTMKPVEQKTGNGCTPPPKENNAGRKPARPVRRRRPWDTEQKAAVRRQLKECFTCNKVPQKSDCERARASEPVLRHRDWSEIKFHVYNELKKVR